MALDPQDVLEAEAAEWAVALDRGLTSEEQATLDAWLAEDTRRQGALVRARAVWIAAAGASTAQSDVHPLNRRRLLAGGLAAGIAGAVGLGLYLGRNGGVSTDRAEVRRLAMADGSEAVMNARSRMVIHFSDAQRRIELRAGEAWFDVVKDRKRPFVVVTPTAVVTAVGTAFSVRKDGDVTEILVSEGTVRVQPAGGAAAVLVSEGQTLRVDPSKPVQKAELDPAHLRRHLAWREGLIMLDGEMLGDAAAAFNAYGGRQIVVAPEVADRRVVGVFRIRDAEGFARANASLLSLQISEAGDEIRLSPSPHVMENSQ